MLPHLCPSRAMRILRWLLKEKIFRGDSDHWDRVRVRCERVLKEWKEAYNVE